MDDRGHEQPGRLAEVDERAQRRVGQHGIGLAQVTQDHLDAGAVSQQPTGLLTHHRVVVHVHDPAPRVDRLHNLVGVAHSRQPGPDIDELANPAPGYPPSCPLMKTPV